jgi:deoxyribodipyrimidine photo-lyase
VNELGMPYKVFTPYRKKWLSELSKLSIRNYASEKKLNNLLKLEPDPVPTLKEIGFSPSPFLIPEPVLNKKIISQYHLFRDYPGRDGTSRLGIHLRHGTISIRKAVQEALSLNDTWLNELIWREFYMMILYHFPWVVEQSFKKSYDRMEWINDKMDFQRWCDGVTGYPIVDAGMRQLIQTGYMHNRARMITASFLTKHLLVDWRLGESYFASKLLDYELASNNGGWQWAAGTGTDAQPYFRIFNPELQTRKYDPDFQYVKKWVPEFKTSSYPPPIIDHNFARKRAINAYKKVLT